MQRFLITWVQVRIAFLCSDLKAGFSLLTFCHWSTALRSRNKGKWTSVPDVSGNGEEAEKEETYFPGTYCVLDPLYALLQQLHGVIISLGFFVLDEKIVEDLRSKVIF